MTAAIGTFNSDVAIGAAIGGLLASGGLGYIFAQLHHWCHWHINLDKNILDHRPIVHRLIDKGLIPFDPRCDMALDKIDKRIAMEITWSLWFQRLGEKSEIKAAEEKIAQLGNIAHVAGTVRIASLAALPTVLWICAEVASFSISLGSVLRFVAMLGLLGGAVLVFHEGWKRMGEIAQRIFDRVLEDILSKEKYARA